MAGVTVKEPRIWIGVEPMPTVRSNEKVLPAGELFSGGRAVGRGSRGVRPAWGGRVAEAAGAGAVGGAMGSEGAGGAVVAATAHGAPSTTVICSSSRSVPLAASSATIEMLYVVL